MQDKNVNAKERNAKILGIALLAVFGAYAVISSIFQFVRGKDWFLEGFITLLVGGVFCTIIGLSFFGKWAAFMRKLKRFDDADALDAEYQNAIAPAKKAEKIKLKPRKRDVIPSVAVLLIGLGVAAVCWYFAARGFAKTNAPYFLRTDAVYRHVGDEIFYEFYDLGGNLIKAPSTIGLSGIKFRDGFTTSVYYHTLHPEVIRQTPVYVVLCGGGIFAAMLGLLIFLHQLDIGLNYLIPFPAAAIFIGLPVCFEVAIATFTGLPFLNLLVSGAGVYAFNGLIILGIYFLCVGVWNIVKKANGYAV